MLLALPGQCYWSCKHPRSPARFWQLSSGNQLLLPLRCSRQKQTKLWPALLLAEASLGQLLWCTMMSFDSPGRAAVEKASCLLGNNSRYKLLLQAWAIQV